jgi:hypothetical protein
LQVPQYCGSVFPFTHASPPVTAHAFGVLPEQVAPQALPAHEGAPVPAIRPGQTFPHAPQLFGSVVSSKQPAGQWSGKLGASQVNAQLDMEHTGVPFVAAGQALAHMPQLSTSVTRSTQTPLQSV